MQGETTGPQVEVPLGTTRAQLEALLRELATAEGGDQAAAVRDQTFAFYVDDFEVQQSLADAVTSSEGSIETVLPIIYQPLSRFRVLPMTRCTASLPGHSDAILHVHFSPNGQYLASGGGDAVVRFWDVLTATPKFVCRGHRTHVLCTAFSPSGDYFASADRSGEIRVWSPSTGKEVCRPLRGHRKWITSLAWEPLHACPEGNRLASASKDGSVRVWNVTSGHFQFSLAGHTDSVECVKWGGEGLIYTGSRDRTIKVWATEGTTRVSTVPVKAPFAVIHVLSVQLFIPTCWL